MDKKAIINQENAVRIVLHILKKNIGFKWDTYTHINKGRYTLIKGPTNIAIMLKREPFYNFGIKFREFNEHGVGDTINVEQLKTYNRLNVKYIYTLFPDGKLYFIDLATFIENSYRWTQKEGTEVRSISIQRYKRAN